MIRLYCNVFLIIAFCTSARAEDISLSFYNQANNKIADVVLSLSPQCESTKKTCTGYWRGITNSDYLKLDSRGMVTAGMKLHSPEVRGLKYLIPPFGNKEIVIHLHPEVFVGDGIIMYSKDLDKLDYGKWVYETDGGLVDQGTFESK